MHTKQLIPKEYVKELNENPYVEKATEYSVRLTSSFKKLAYDEYLSGKDMRRIFSDAGLDPDIFGKIRLQSFREALMARADSEHGFEDKRADNYRKEPQSTEAQMAKRIRELEHRNAYLEQENDFLKKIQSLEKECTGKAGKRK